ncbi:MAG: dihydrolipoyl dehydrogenase [Fimbriimonadaceae bacterium]|nr:dihydrolipoyl dehydrogenase [Fimbriimonadaceae bacterium]QYK56993.1 MAG: dihydrolipoyl dehydrogenase [Fimbriimonadaceae bacterium]
MPQDAGTAGARGNMTEAIAGSPTVLPKSGVESLIRQIADIPGTKEQTEPMAQEQFDTDLVVIGAGPGGYVAAIRAALLGAKVVCVEKEFHGGTCLNWGCIPSKAMIASVERLHAVKHAADFGVEIKGDIGFDFKKMSDRRDKIVKTLRGGVGMLFKKKGVESMEGYARLTGPNTVTVEKDGKSQSIKAKNIILAMGSKIIVPPIPGLEGGRDQNIWTSDDAVTAPFLPKRILIIGGGVIGVEFGFVFNGLGSEVTVVEMMPRVLPMMDEDLGTELGKQLSRQGIKLMTSTAVERLERAGEGWKVHVKTSAGEQQQVEVDVVLVAVGRRAFTDEMGLEQAGVKLHRGGIEVNDFMQTSVPNIYAIGDVTGRVQLAHTASYEGQVAAENCVRGPSRRADRRAIPNCIYTNPEVASVGLTEGEAKEQGYDVMVGKFAFRPLGKAMAAGEQEGFVKVVAEHKYGEVLGVHVIGAHATDLIAQAVTAIKLEATVDAMVDTIHAHPTMTEAFLEAYEDTHGVAIHKM